MPTFERILDFDPSMGDAARGAADRYAGDIWRNLLLKREHDLILLSLVAVSKTYDESEIKSMVRVVDKRDCREWWGIADCQPYAIMQERKLANANCPEPYIQVTSRHCDTYDDKLWLKDIERITPLGTCSVCIEFRGTDGLESIPVAESEQNVMALMASCRMGVTE